MIRKAFGATFVTTIVLVIAGPVSAVPGTLDTTFSGDGQVTTPFSTGGASAEALAVQGDGRIVAAGWVDLSQTKTAWALTRYKANGRLDTSFGKSGKVVTDFTSGDDEAWGVVVQKDGKIVAGGFAGGEFAAARYLSNGTLDKSFSGDGKVTVDFTPVKDAAWDVVLSPGGKIVLVGQARSDNQSVFAFARLNGDGSLDKTFSGDGKATDAAFGPPSIGWDAIVRPDGSIVATGNSNAGAFAAVVVTSLLPNGKVDQNFGDSGSWVAQAPNNAYANAIVRLPSGKFIVGASVQAAPDEYDVGVFRFLANGQEDDSFGTNGLVTQDFKSSELVTDLQRTGTDFVISIGRFRSGKPSQLGVVRLLPSGAKDKTFGDNGLAVSTLPNADGEALVVQQDGKLVAAGEGRPTPTDRFAVARFLAS